MVIYKLVRINNIVKEIDMAEPTGKILLYYKYTDVESPGAIAKWQNTLCNNLKLTGRIIIAHEGINGTVGGTSEDTQAYIDAMNEHPLFGGIDFKISPGGSEYFPRMRIVVKDEICALGIDPTQVTVADGGKHLTPDEAHELLQRKPNDLVVLDARNNYESAIGKFEGAITPDIKNFRDFPEYIDNNLETFKGKKVLMYCTGGVRCERATAYLQQKGVAQEIYQIEGGIQRYGEKYPDGFYRGKNYVFDSRVSVDINDDILGACYLCNKSNSDYYNCLNALCNKHFTCCKSCLDEYQNTCSKVCLERIITQDAKPRPAFVKLP